jgi:CRISPR-associated exonuclease Cas4
MIWLCLAAGCLLVMVALRVRRSTGLPWQRITSSDMGRWQPIAAPLIARRYGLVGKPDYLIQGLRGQIPVEVKPGRRAKTPYQSDLLQLAAYCLLVEETTGTRPPYGLLRYAETTFKVPFDARLRGEVLGVLREMRALDPRVSSHRSHDVAGRCGGCGFRSQCDEALA